MAPKWFQLSYQIDPDHGRPWVTSITADVVYSPPCRACGGRTYHYRGTAVAHGLSGRYYGDIVGSGGDGPRFMVSERVVAAMMAARKPGFVAYPVEFVDMDDRERAKTPRYYHLCVTSRITFDAAKSGLPVKSCPECRFVDVDALTQERQLIPVEESWDGAMLFSGGNYALGRVFCTMQVIDLARSNRWTNFVFNPIDVNREHALNWNGIDYLGKQWPPKWYPDATSDGKPLEEWVAGLQSDDWQVNYPATLALLDRGSDSLQPILRILENGIAPREARERRK